MKNQRDPYGPCHCGSGKKHKFCCAKKSRSDLAKPGLFPELEADFKLGQQLVKEYEKTNENQ